MTRPPQYRALPWVTGLAALLAGCAAPPPPSGPYAPPPVGALPPAATTEILPSAVVGTPFLIAFKIPACIASVIFSGPTAAAFTLANQGLIPPEQDLMEDTNRAIDVYCSPPTLPP
jgi:hypothetical protein